LFANNDVSVIKQYSDEKSGKIILWKPMTKICNTLIIDIRKKEKAVN